ncbi:VOC family protein [Tahibacter amnicola]|uniref:VOC family protein n=1 Tax=Tahibacter amnicola TaxID=2976241 RepID=A0ABY6BDF0_9GAMM|nr:VOC family protein [Tahibacter amnicola]UXI66641.1 VOC family protein [Tahibacter amnicola]
MSNPHFVILYVRNPLVSAAFYEDLLAIEPAEFSPTFAMFPLNTHLMLGLWSRRTVEPAARGAGRNGELAFPVADDATVDALHEAWSRKGLPIVQSPTSMDFGRTFVALDPDGHRLRVFAAAAR